MHGASDRYIFFEGGNAGLNDPAPAGHRAPVSGRTDQPRHQPTPSGRTALESRSAQLPGLWPTVKAKSVRQARSLPLLRAAVACTKYKAGLFQYCAAGHGRHDRPRHRRLLQDRQLLLVAPVPTPLHPYNRSAITATAPTRLLWLPPVMQEVSAPNSE